MRFKDARDARRSADVDSILTAIYSYIVDHRGTLPGDLTSGMGEKQLGTSGSGCALTQNGCSTATACDDLSASLSAYLKSVPVDPGSTASASKTQYSVIIDSNGIVTVKACSVENIPAGLSSSR